jgi:predicted HNH restriction endonuclease
MGYRRGKKVYWRSLCDTCIRKKKKLRIGGITPCEVCGFKAQESLQLDIFFVDGNKNNCAFHNLKTVCANCQRLASIRKLRWKIGDLEVDE